MAGRKRAPVVGRRQVRPTRGPHVVRVPASRFPTDLERITFAVGFVQADLATLSASGWAHLRAQFERLRWPSRSGSRRVGRAQLVVAQAPWADPERELPEAVVRKLQRETAQLVNDIVDAREAVRRVPFVPPRAHRLLFHAIPLVFPDRVVRQVDGRPRDLFLHLLFAAFEHEPPDRLRRCPECRAVFVRSRKQTFCSPRCNNRVTARKWRAKPSVKKKRSKNARDKYDAKVRAQHDGNVVVGRDRRKAAKSSENATGQLRER